jgi:hypothetical protein
MKAGDFGERFEGIRPGGYHLHCNAAGKVQKRGPNRNSGRVKNSYRSREQRVKVQKAIQGQEVGIVRRFRHQGIQNPQIEQIAEKKRDRRRKRNFRNPTGFTGISGFRRK